MCVCVCDLYHQRAEQLPHVARGQLDVPSAVAGLSPGKQDSGQKILAKALIGEAESEERWRECVADTDGSFGFATGAMFVRHAFDEAARDKV